MTGHQAAHVRIAADSLHSNLLVDWNIVLVLENDDCETVVRGTFLSGRRKPRQHDVLVGEVRKLNSSIERIDRDIGSQEVAFRVKAVSFEVGVIRVYNSDCEKSFISFEGMDVEPEGGFAGLGVDEVTWRYLMMSECHTHVHHSITSRDNIRYKVHLCHSLLLNQSAVFAPLSFCKVSIDWLVHISLAIFKTSLHIGIVDVCKDFQVL